jgi:hypothetical protein
LFYISISESVVIGFTTFFLHFCFLLTITGKEPMDKISPSTPPDDNDCVSHMELKDIMRAMTGAFNKYQTTTTDTFQRIHTSVDGLAARLDMGEARFSHHAPPPIIPAAGGLAQNDIEDEFNDDEVDA